MEECLDRVRTLLAYWVQRGMKEELAIEVMDRNEHLTDNTEDELLEKIGALPPAHPID